MRRPRVPPCRQAGVGGDQSLTKHKSYQTDLVKCNSNDLKYSFHVNSSVGGLFMPNGKCVCAIFGGFQENAAERRLSPKIIEWFFFLCVELVELLCM